MFCITKHYAKRFAPRIAQLTYIALLEQKRLNRNCFEKLFWKTVLENCFAKLFRKTVFSCNCYGIRVEHISLFSTGKVPKFVLKISSILPEIDFSLHTEKYTSDSCQIIQNQIVFTIFWLLRNTKTEFRLVQNSITENATHSLLI